MNEQSYFQWDFFRPPLHSPSFAMGASFLDIREEAMRGMQNKKTFSLDQSCALWSKDIGLDGADGIPTMGGRVLEIRKEKSRDAARSRRGKENYEFYELAKLLPLPAAITSQLDKASIIRLSISYLKLRDFCGHGDPPWPRDGPQTGKTLKGNQRRRNGPGLPLELFEIHQGAHILQSLDGFAFALSNDGRFLYISETVSIYLGLSQVEMAGSSIFDYVHGQDHQELADQLGIGLAAITNTLSSPASPSADSPPVPRAVTPPVSERVPVMSPSVDKGPDRTFCVRMKSTLTKRGVHSRSSGYRVVLFVGQFRYQISYPIGGRKGPAPLLGLAGVAIALPPPTITELRLEADTFIMRLTPKFKVTYCENMISALTDWKSDEVSGKDLYSLCHPGHICDMRKAHTDLLLKGQVMSPSMRFLNKGGGYIWVQMCATSLYTSKLSDDQTVLAIFQTISSIEHRGVVMDTSQLENSSAHACSSDSEQEMTPIFNEPSPVTSPKDLGSSATTTSEGKQAPPVDGQIDALSVFPDSVENDFLLDEPPETSSRLDNKISRRKTDRPRKRKREADEPSVEADTNDMTERLSVSSDNTSDDSMDAMNENILNLSANHSSLPSSSPGVRSPEVASPQLPEDLSLRTLVNKHTGRVVEEKDAIALSNNNDVMTSSVKELEKVMNRHLPSRGVFSLENEDLIRNFTESQRSTIQWVGSGLSSASNDSLSASAFLRHLYTSRESVIRSNGRPHCYNGTDMNSLAMLTPPTADACKDQLHLNIPLINVQSKPQFHTGKESVSLMNATADDFSMTPPSSVSPQDKLTSPFQQENDVTNECMNIRAAHTGNHVAIQPVADCTGDFTKSNFLAPSTYQYHDPGLNHFAPAVGTSGSLAYDARPGTSNHGIWYGSAYTS